MANIEVQVRKTQRAIKHALTERFYTWQDASQVARSDPEIDLESSDGNTYLPGSYEEEALEDVVAKETEKKTKEAMKAEAKEEQAEKQPS